MVVGVTHSIGGKMRGRDRVCWHRYAALSGAGTQACSLTGQSLFLEAWIRLWSRCRVNMKAFTAVKKSGLWLDSDVWECFLMPAFADDGPFKSSRAFAGSLPSKMCWNDSFTSTCALYFCYHYYYSLLFFPAFFLNVPKGRSQALQLGHVWSKSLPQSSQSSTVVSRVIKQWISDYWLNC